MQRESADAHTLHQVATEGLSPADIAYPIRSILRHQKNTNVILANVSGVDLVAREILAEDRRIPCDMLMASSMRFRPGACGAQLSRPK
jgi:NADH:ubiquinone reductase (H+-translocating)